MNTRNKKARGKNVALKFDIRKDLDILDWNYLINLFKAFGFNMRFCNCITFILNPLKLSYDSLAGYFNCSRVMQGSLLRCFV